MGSPRQAAQGVLAVLLVLAALPAGAGETDQYLAWGAELEDSGDALNAYVNEGIELVLTRQAARPAETCEELPPRIYRYLFHGLLRSRLRHYLDEDPAIDRHPGEEVRYFEYLRTSVFRRPAFPFLMPMSRTIRVGDVYLGIDKINHIFGFGRRYYKHYQRHRRRGLAEAEAVRRTVAWGFMTERYFLGGMLDGILSFADLEANYQGLRLARDLCEAEPPHLQLVEGRWRLARPVDLRDYVNPRLDESFNPNRYSWWRWRQVRPELEESVCPRLAEPAVRARWRFYLRTDAPSWAELMLEEIVPERMQRRRLAQSVHGVCPPALVTRLGQPAPPVVAGR